MMCTFLWRGAGASHTATHRASQPFLCLCLPPLLSFPTANGTALLPPLSPAPSFLLCRPFPSQSITLRDDNDPPSSFFAPLTRNSTVAGVSVYRVGSPVLVIPYDGGWGKWVGGCEKWDRAGEGEGGRFLILAELLVCGCGACEKGGVAFSGTPFSSWHMMMVIFVVGCGGCLLSNACFLSTHGCISNAQCCLVDALRRFGDSSAAIRRFSAIRHVCGA
jgi:hypothetical protein